MTRVARSAQPVFPSAAIPSLFELLRRKAPHGPRTRTLAHRELVRRREGKDREQCLRELGDGAGVIA
jgi:hypothetical protein